MGARKGRQVAVVAKPTKPKSPAKKSKAKAKTSK